MCACCMVLMALDTLSGEKQHINATNKQITGVIPELGEGILPPKKFFFNCGISNVSQREISKG